MALSKEIIIVSDIHYSKLNDTISKKLGNKYDFVDANKEFRNFIKSVKKNQLLVINGDIIDYKYQDYIKQDKTNWILFKKELKNIKSKIILNMGNHEYLTVPYNLSIYGLNHFNISRNILKKFNYFNFNKFRWFKEFYSFVHKTKDNDLLKEYNLKETNYKLFSNFGIITLNTGQNISPSFFTFLNFKNWKVFDNKNPSSRGLLDFQIDFLKNKLKNSKQKNMIVCIHNPPFFTEHKFKPIKVLKKSYNNMRFKHGLFSDTFIKNNWNFIKSLLESNKNIFVVSGHTHLPKQFILDKTSLILNQSNLTEINENFDNKNKIKFITTPALGVISKYNKKLGYIKISNKIQQVIVKDLNTNN